MVEQRGARESGGRAQGGMHAPTLVGATWLHRPTSCAYIYSYTLKTSRSTTKPYFHRGNILYPRDPILGPIPELHRRGALIMEGFYINTIASPMKCE